VNSNCMGFDGQFRGYLDVLVSFLFPSLVDLGNIFPDYVNSLILSTGRFYPMEKLINTYYFCNNTILIRGRTRTWNFNTDWDKN
jgi:hypothetical protein